MVAEIIFRILGFFLFGIIGWLIGTVLADTTTLNAQSARYILPLALVGAIIGALIAPWLTIRPAAWVRRVINELTAAQLLAASIGLVIGLAIAALAAFPFRSCPHRSAASCPPSPRSSSATWALP